MSNHNSIFVERLNCYVCQGCGLRSTEIIESLCPLICKAPEIIDQSADGGNNKVKKKCKKCGPSIKPQ